MSEIIPMRVRIARRQHACSNYPPCRVPIMPGERYEDHRQPPGSYDWGDYRHWITHKVHAPSSPHDGPTGCEVAAAYHEHAVRDAASAQGQHREDIPA
jgi:hypothetical protein